MARDIGPELLADLERIRPQLDPAAYEARKIELQELIRKGRAVELSVADRVGQALLVLLGVAALVYIGRNNPVMGLLVAVACWWFAARWGRPLW